MAACTHPWLNDEITAPGKCSGNIQPMIALHNSVTVRRIFSGDPAEKVQNLFSTSAVAPFAPSGVLTPLRMQASNDDRASTIVPKPFGPGQLFICWAETIAIFTSCQYPNSAFFQTHKNYICIQRKFVVSAKAPPSLPFIFLYTFNADCGIMCLVPEMYKSSPEESECRIL